MFDPEAPADARTPGDSRRPDDVALMPVTPALLHVATGVSGAGSVSVPIQATAAGHFLLVGVVTYNGDSVVSVTDDATNAYTSTGARAIISAGGASEIWYARNIQPNATQVLITISAPGGLEAWVAELSGIDASPIATAIANDQSSGATVVAPTVTTASPNAVVVSVAGIVSGAAGIHAGNPFTSLGIPNGDIAAYYIASVPGAYGAVIDENSSGLSCASTAAFPAAQM